jgi:hypothetical protein
MSSKRDLVTFIFFLIKLFLILSFLEIRAEHPQKSISVELSFAVVFAFKHHVSIVIIYIYICCAVTIIQCHNVHFMSHSYAHTDFFSLCGLHNAYILFLMFVEYA